MAGGEGIAHTVTVDIVITAVIGAEADQATIGSIA
jgi:hypothetical protein